MNTDLVGCLLAGPTAPQSDGHPTTLMVALRTHVHLFLTRPPGQVLLIAAAFLAVFTAGALFLPVGSGPDEAAHYVYAAAVVRGQAATLEPTLPERIANIHQFATCLAFQPDITAACQGPLRLTGGAGDVLTQTNAGLYNPVFYAWTGLGSLIVPTEYGLYLSRLLSGTVTSAVFGWSVSLLIRTTSSLWPRAGLALLLTPMALYTGMVLNPSAWEIASMTGVVAAAHAILRRRVNGRWSEAHTLLVVAGLLLIVSRGLSPFLLVLTMVSLLLTRRGARIRTLLMDRSTWAVAGAFAVAGGLAAGWVVGVGTNYVGVMRPASLREGIAGISVFYSNFHDQLAQMYGVLGWLDLPSPNVLSAAWVFLLGFFLVTSFALGGSLGRRGILLSFSVAVLLPGVLAGLQWSGMGWQGRYTLPLVAACVLISGLSLDEAASASREAGMLRLSSVARVILPAFFVIGTGAMTLQVVHRYVVGVSQPWLAPPSWDPPVNGIALSALLVLGLAGTLIAQVWSPRRDSHDVATST